jgi:Flp pilus assembly protein TadB
MGLCVLTAMVAAASIGRPRRRPSGRLALALRPKPATSSSTAQPDPHSPHRPLRRLLLAAVVGAAGVLAIGGVLGIGLGLAGATVIVVVRPPRAAPSIDPDEVPVVVDLVAGCLAAGASLPDALDAASRAAEAVLRAACLAVATALRSGAPPEEAWRSWLADPWLAPVARTAVRTSLTGAAAAADLSRTATRLRARRRAAAQHRVRQASVWLVVPLGLCFLPAFVLVAVVPLVVGLVPSLR